MCENHDAMVAGGLAFAETRLKITDAQRPAWDKFATAVKNSDGAMAKRCADPAKMKPPATLPERAQRMEEMMTARLEQIRQVRPALDEVYATFTASRRRPPTRWSSASCGTVRAGRRLGRPWPRRPRPRSWSWPEGGPGERRPG